MSSENSLNYHQFYDLESYLFDTVQCRFKEQGYLSAFDFFCIVIWKANRAKSKIAKRLLQVSGEKNLDAATRKLTTEIAQQLAGKERFKCLLGKWQFRLPMATAILTVLYSDEFTVYDERVCGELGSFHNLIYLSNLDRLWQRYEEFRNQVRGETPQEIGTLRDKDRYLFGRSFYRQLKHDIERRFTDERIPDSVRQNPTHFHHL